MTPTKIFMFLITPPPPSRNAKIQKLIAKHVVECLKIEKRKTAKNIDSKT